MDKQNYNKTLCANWVRVCFLVFYCTAKKLSNKLGLIKIGGKTCKGLYGDHNYSINYCKWLLNYLSVDQRTSLSTENSLLIPFFSLSRFVHYVCSLKRKLRFRRWLFRGLGSFFSFIKLTSFAREAKQPDKASNWTACNKRERALGKHEWDQVQEKIKKERSQKQAGEYGVEW